MDKNYYTVGVYANDEHVGQLSLDANGQTEFETYSACGSALFDLVSQGYVKGLQFIIKSVEPVETTESQRDNVFDGDEQCSEPDVEPTEDAGYLDRSDYEIRLAALQLVVGRGYGHSTRAINDADAFYKFLKGENNE